MTVSNTTVKQIFLGDGSTQDFAIPFAFIDNSTIKVYLRNNTTGVETLQTLTTHYTLTGGSPVTTVHMLTAPALTTESLIVIRSSPKTQPDAFSVGAFPAAAVEARYDKIEHQIQELGETLDRSIKLPMGSSVSSISLPEAEANKFIGWNSAGTALENKDPLDIATLQAQITALDLRVDGHDTDIATLQGNITTINGTLTTLGNAIIGNTADIVTLQGESFNHGVDIGNLQAAVAGLSDQAANIATLQGQVSTLQSQMTTANSNIAANATSIAAVANRVSALETIAYQLARRKVGSMTIANNNSTPTTVVGSLTGTTLDLNKTGAFSGEVFIEIERKTDSKHIFTTGKLALHCVNSTWLIVRDTITTINGILADDNTADGVTFTIATVGDVGTVKYTTDNMAGASYSGSLRWMLQEISNTF